MRSLIAYALIASTALLLFVLVARSHLRRRSRSHKHLRIDLLSGRREASEGRGSVSSRGDAAPSNLP